MLKQQLSSVVLTRSSNCVSTAAKDKAELDVAFRQSIEGKFCIAAPTGILTIRTFDDLSAQTDEIMTLIAGLEQRIAKLEQALAQQKRVSRGLSTVIAQYGHERMKGSRRTGKTSYSMPFIRSCPSET